MANGEFTPVTAGISRKTYAGMTTEGKLDALLDFSIAHEESLECIKEQLAKKKKIDIKISASSGLGGGLAAIFLKWLLFR